MRQPFVMLVLVGFCAFSASCLTVDDDPPRPAGDGSSTYTPNEAGGCAVTCSMVTCGRYACDKLCQEGSGCKDDSCTGKPCGSGFCHYGSGCFCGGQPCVSSGCPPGTGCI